MTQKKEKVVRVKLRQGAAGPEWSARAGDVVWLEEEAAGQLVAGGFAELVEEKGKVEPQEAGVVEVAALEEGTGPVLPPMAAEETAVATTAERAERAVAGRKRAPAARKDEGGGMKAEKKEKTE